MSGRHRRLEKEFVKNIAMEENISKKQARKRYVTKANQMSFVDDWE